MINYSVAANCWEEKVPIAITHHQELSQKPAGDELLNVSIELTWLHHDVAKCYLALASNLSGASDQIVQDYLQKAEARARSANEWAEKAVAIVAVPEVPLSRLIAEDSAAAEAYRWLLFSQVVAAQVAEKKAATEEKSKKDAQGQYSKALELASKLEDSNAVQAIQTALQAIVI